MRGNYELRVTNYDVENSAPSVQEVVRGLVRRCGKAVEALYGQAVDKGAAREELREVVRVVDGLARLATAGAAGAADVRWTMYDVRFGEFARLRRGDAELMRSKHCELSMGTHEGWVE